MKDVAFTFEQLPAVVGQLFQKMEAIELMLSKLSSAPTGDQSINDLMDIHETSEFTRLSIPTIYSKCSKREIPFHKQKGGKKLFFSRSELTNLIKNGRVKTIDEVYSEAGSNMNIKKGGCNG